MGILPKAVEIDKDYYKRILDNLFDGVYFVDRERRITYWNKGAERLTGFSPDEVVGKRCADNLLIHVDEKGDCLCLGDCPLSESIQTGQLCEKEAYLHHKDGHRIPVAIRATPLFDAAGTVLGAVEVFQDISNQRALFLQMKELKEMALLDPVTKLPNRRHTETSLQLRLQEAVRYRWPFGILFIDIDHFKQINDAHGHEVGDKVLRLVAMTLLNSLRPFDFLGRWGGEEFVAIAVNVGHEQLFHIAERARRLVSQSTLRVDSGAIQVTVSIGATLARGGESLESLVQRADALMYQGKNQGRNRVVS